MVKIIKLSKNEDQASFENVPIFQDEGERDGVILKDFLRILFYPVILVCNALILRCPFFKKEKCSVKILGKESRETGMEVPFGDSAGGVSIQTFLLHFKLKGAQTFIEVEEEFFNSYAEGDQILIEYIDGLDRFHAQLVPEEA